VRCPRGGSVQEAIRPGKVSRECRDGNRLRASEGGARLVSLVAGLILGRAIP